MQNAELLSPQLLEKIAKLALSGLTREFPHKLDHVYFGPEDVRGPRVLHPTFYGCYDWHSAVHSHWALIQCLDRFPALDCAPAACAVLRSHLSAESLATELGYLRQPGRQGFERPYGWAWLFRLTMALKQWNYPEAKDWFKNIHPIAECLIGRLLDWLPCQTYPVRSGTHTNTAFALAFALDYANACELEDQVRTLQHEVLRLYGEDSGFNFRTEPSGNDFLSPILSEVDLMRRVLPQIEWRQWCSLLLAGGLDECLLQPVVVSDRADGQGVHLDGLNLSRAWQLEAISRSVDERDLRLGLSTAAYCHWEASLPHLETGDFLGEHWLGTFVLFAGGTFDDRETVK